MTPIDPIALVQAIIAIAKRRFELFILPAIILLPGGWYAFKKLPRKYKSSTKIVIQEPKYSNPFLGRFTSPTRLKKRIMLLTNIVTSYKVLSRIVQKELDQTGKKLTRRQMHYRVSALRRQIKIMYLGQGLVQLEFACGKPSKCLDNLNFVFSQFMKETLRPQKEAVQRSSRFLAVQIRRLKENLEKTEKKLARYKQKHSLELPETFNVNLNTYTFVRKKQTQTQIALASALQKRDFLYKKLRFLDPVLVRLKQRRTDLLIKMSKARARYTSRHPKMRHLRILLGRVSRSIRLHTPKRPKTLKEIEDSMRWSRSAKQVFKDSMAGGSSQRKATPFERLQEAILQVSVLKKRMGRYKLKAAGLKVRLSAYPKREQRLALLKRESQISRDLYVRLRALYEESLLRRELEIFDSSKRISVVEPAILPIFPTFPKKPMILGGAFVASFVLSIMLIAIAEVSDRSIKSSQEASGMFEHDVVGSFGLLPNVEL